MTTATGGEVGVERIGQIAFTVSDLPRAVAFYRDVLGLRFLFEAPPSLAFFDCGGTRLMLSPPEREGAVAGQQFNSVLYYAVADIEAASRALIARGVTFEQPAHLIARLAAADLWMAFFRDPDRNMLALMSEVPRA
ncbi:MAG TPA: VOC family protein [Vicinamibacterales bacterium]|nr:VOC family protein [Vicinamibacterales bacterium]